MSPVYDVCSRVMDVCFTKAKADFLLCARCMPVPQVSGRVNCHGSYLYSLHLEGDVER